MILHGNALHLPLKDKSVQCVVTSPPYWGLRDYGIGGQLGLESTPQAFVTQMVAVFQEVWRVLRDDGTCWVNLGDSYAAGGGSDAQRLDELGERLGTGGGHKHSSQPSGRAPLGGLKPKNLVGIPWRVAFALQDAGWYLRQDIIWSKPNPMPESVTDRCTKAHEYVFLLSKKERYYFDAEAIKEPTNGTAHRRAAYKTPDGWDTSTGKGGHGSFHREGREKGFIPGVSPKSAPAGSGIKANESFHAATTDLVNSRNKRSVWTIATQPFSGVVSYGTRRIASLSCRVHGCPACLSHAQQCGGRLASFCSLHNQHTADCLSRVQAVAVSSILGDPSVFLGNASSAISHNNEPHKRVVSLRQDETSSDISASDIACIPPFLHFCARCAHTHASSIEEDAEACVMDLHPLVEIASHKQDNWASDFPPSCLCYYTGKVKKRQDHFAVFPEKLVEPCILAGSKRGDIVLDPFAGSGTVLKVATLHGRQGIGIELNPSYCQLAQQRLNHLTPRFF